MIILRVHDETFRFLATQLQQFFRLTEKISNEAGLPTGTWRIFDLENRRKEQQNYQGCILLTVLLYTHFMVALISMRCVREYFLY